MAKAKSVSITVPINDNKDAVLVSAIQLDEKLVIKVGDGSIELPANYQAINALEAAIKGLKHAASAVATHNCFGPAVPVPAAQMAAVNRSDDHPWFAS